MARQLESMARVLGYEPMVYGLPLGLDFQASLLRDVGLQKGKFSKTSPLYGVGMQDPCGYLQEQIKVTTESEIVVKFTAANPKSMSADYETEVRDVVAFYHWDFLKAGNSTTILIRSYCNLRTDKRPAEAILTDLTMAFHKSWNKSLNNLASIVGNSSANRTSDDGNA